jgi:Secretion system C-terminal sorting domain
MKKILSILRIAAFCSISSAVQAQIQYKLTRLPDNVTYMVSILPQTTWTFPQNVVTTAQVTVRVPVNARFIAGRIASLVPETRWTDNAYLEHPVGDASHNYITFNLQTIGTKAFTFETGRELPLFTFQNIGNSCFGTMELVDNQSIATKSVVAGGYNIGQHIGTLGAGGEAFVNNVNIGVNCESATKNEDLNANLFKIAKIYPVPATTELSVEWQGTDKMAENVYLIVHNVLGEVVFKQNVKNTKTLQINKIDVSKWIDGMYTLQLQSQKNVSVARTFVVYHF